MSEPANTSQPSLPDSSVDVASPPIETATTGDSMFFSASALLAAAPIIIDFTVAELMPVGLVILTGRPKAGKSYFLLDLACSVAVDEDFLDRPVNAGSVLYYPLEDGDARLQNRLQARLGKHSIAQNITFRGTKGTPLTIAELATEVAEWSTATPNARLVIIDVIGRVSIPTVRNANEYERMSAALGLLHALAHKYRITIVIVHHMKKATHHAVDIFDAALGTTAFTSVPDTLMAIEGSGKEPRVLHVKGRDVPDHEIGIKIDHDACRILITEGALQRALTPEQERILELVHSGSSTPHDITARSGLSRTSVQNILRKLLDHGRLERTATGVYRPPNVKAASEPVASVQSSAEPIDDPAEHQPSYTGTEDTQTSDDYADTSTLGPNGDEEPDSAYIGGEEDNYTRFIDF